MQGRQVKRNRLNDRQRAFCNYYLRYHSATKAYQKAYKCSYKSANSNSWYLMVNPKVHEYLSELEQKVAHNEFMTTEDVIHQWAKAVYASMNDYATWNYKKGHNNLHFKPSNQVDGSLIQSIKDGKNGAEITLIDKNRALENLIDVLPNAKPSSRVDTLVSAFKQGQAQDDSIRKQNQKLKAELTKAKVTNLRTKSAVNRSKLPTDNKPRKPMFLDGVLKHHQHNEAEYRRKHSKHEN